MKKIVLSFFFFILASVGLADNTFYGQHFPNGVVPKEIHSAYIKDTKIPDPAQIPYHLDENGRKIWNKFPAPHPVDLAEWVGMDMLTFAWPVFILIPMWLWFWKRKDEGKLDKAAKSFALVLLGGWFFNYFRYEIQFHTNWGGPFWANWEDLAFCGMIIYLFFVTSFGTARILKFTSRICLAAIFIIVFSSGNMFKNPTWGKLNASTIISNIPGWIFNFVTPEQFGGGTSVADNTTAFNAAVTQSYTSGSPILVLGNGTYNLTTGCIKMFHINNAGTSFIGWTGAKMLGFSHPDGSIGTYPVISQAVTNLPVIACQYLYGYNFQGFTLAGKATWANDGTAYLATHYLQSRGVTYTKGCLDLSYAAHAGIDMDPFSALNAGQTYVNSYLTSYYGLNNAGDSHNGVVENVGFNGLVCGFMNCPADGGLGDGIHLFHCVGNWCQYPLVDGCTQSDGNTATDCDWSYFLAMKEEVQYGTGHGSGWKIDGGEWNTGAFVCEGSYDNEQPSNFSNAYCEGVWGVGFIGGTASGRTYNFNSIDFNYFGGAIANTGVRDNFAIIGGQVYFRDCMFTDANGDENAVFRMSYTNSNARVVFENCKGGLFPTLENGIVGFFGDMNGYFNFKNFDYLDSVSASDRVLNNDGMENPTNGSMVIPGTMVNIADGNLYVTPQGATSAAVTFSGSYTPASANNGTATINSFGTGPQLEIGDAVFTDTNNTYVEASTSAGSTTRLASSYALGVVSQAWTSGNDYFLLGHCPVTTNVNSTLTFNHLFVKHIPKWHSPLYGTTSSGSSIITGCYTVSSSGVTSTNGMSDWAQYDWMYGAGLPSFGDRYVGTNGSGTVTVTTNATASVTAGMLYDVPYQKFEPNCAAVGDTRGPVSVTGTAGYYTWSMPFQNTENKQVIINFAGYTNSAPSTITFPKAFIAVPNTADLVTNITLTTTASNTIVAITASAATGQIILQGQ